MDKNNIRLYVDWKNRANRAKKAAHNVLRRYEGGIQSRVIELRKLMNKLDELPVDIKSYFLESVKCLEWDLRRAAIVMAWAGFFEVFAEQLYSVHESDIRIERNKWKFGSFEEFKERFSESSIIEVAKEVGFITNAERRVIDGQLSSRNRCAHPSLYNPTLNYAIGYVDEIIAQAENYI